MIEFNANLRTTLLINTHIGICISFKHSPMMIFISLSDSCNPLIATLYFCSCSSFLFLILNVLYKCVTKINIRNTIPIPKKRKDVFRVLLSVGFSVFSKLLDCWKVVLSLYALNSRLVVSGRKRNPPFIFRNVFFSLDKVYNCWIERRSNNRFYIYLLIVVCLSDCVSIHKHGGNLL